MRNSNVYRYSFGDSKRRVICKKQKVLKAIHQKIVDNFGRSPSDRQENLT